MAEGVPARDPRLAVYAKAHLSERAARPVRPRGRPPGPAPRRADEEGPRPRPRRAPLWGGILGDDGIDGIEVGRELPGRGLRAFQRVAKQLGAQGVLLAAVSKNDIEPVPRCCASTPT